MGHWWPDAESSGEDEVDTGLKLGRPKGGCCLSVGPSIGRSSACVSVSKDRSRQRRTTTSRAGAAPKLRTREGASAAARVAPAGVRVMDSAGALGKSGNQTASAGRSSSSRLAVRNKPGQHGQAAVTGDGEYLA